MGTGIVFVVLVAIWAAYFLQYWSRRREHLATARSVEAFSEAMRVLERRPALRASSEHRVSSAYAVSPARVLSTRPAPRPQVMAKPHSAAPQHSRGGDPSMRMPTLPRMSAWQTHPERSEQHRQARRSQSPGGPRRSGPSHGARRAISRQSGSRSPHGQSTGPRPSRQIRGLTFLALVATTLVTVGLAAVGILLWIAPAIAGVVTVAGFFWLRAGVQVEIRARRATRRRGHRAHSTAARASEGRTARARSTGLDGTDGSAPAGAATGVGEELDVAAPAVHDELRSSATVLAEAGGLQSNDSVGARYEEHGGPDAWSPVPVPPPTYTLKAKAERPAPVYDNELGQPEAFESAGVEDEVAHEQEHGREQRAAYGT